MISKIIRRIHMYLALFIAPWVLVKPYEREVPDRLSRNELHELGIEVLADLDIDIRSRFGAYSIRERQFTVYVHDFWSYTRITYDINKNRIKIEDKRFRWNQFLSGMHQRGGFAQASVLNDLWAIVVDFVAIGFVLWVASGLYMWWQLKRTRRWGLVALLSGTLSFTTFIFAL